MFQAASGGKYHNATLTRPLRNFFGADREKEKKARSLAETEFVCKALEKQEPKDCREWATPNGVLFLPHYPFSFLAKWGESWEGRRAQKAPPRNSEHFLKHPTPSVNFPVSESEPHEPRTHPSGSLSATHLLCKPLESLTPGVP